MPDENRILEGLGKLSGLVESSREDIKALVVKHDEQSKSIQNLATAVQVLQTNQENKSREVDASFKEVNQKLGRDYVAINELKTKTLVENGVEAYKGKKREWWQYVLGVVGGIIMILIGLNQLYGLVQKVDASRLSAPSAYGATAADSTFRTLDTLNGR